MFLDYMRDPCLANFQTTITFTPLSSHIKRQQSPMVSSALRQMRKEREARLKRAEEGGLRFYAVAQRLEEGRRAMWEGDDDDPTTGIAYDYASKVRNMANAQGNAAWLRELDMIHQEMAAAIELIREGLPQTAVQVSITV